MATPKHPLFDVQVPFYERHYTVPQLAKMWGLAAGTVRPWFLAEPGVIRVGESRLRKGKKRAYLSLRIPESVAAKIYRAKTEKK